MLPGMTTSAETSQEAPWTADASTFGARLALIRQRMGWGNVKTAADQCGLPVESWRNWERDGIEPRRLNTIAMTIATVTGCDYLWLVHGPERGATVPRRHYVTAGQRVIVQVQVPPENGTRPADASPGSGQAHHARPVRQTRPVVGAAPRPLTPVAV
jgi:hypothetical protein